MIRSNSVKVMKYQVSFELLEMASVYYLFPVLPMKSKWFVHVNKNRCRMSVSIKIESSQCYCLLICRECLHTNIQRNQTLALNRASSYLCRNWKMLTRSFQGERVGRTLLLVSHIPELDTFFVTLYQWLKVLCRLDQSLEF